MQHIALGRALEKCRYVRGGLQQSDGVLLAILFAYIKSQP